MLFSALALVGALTGVFGAPASTVHVLHEKREVEPSKWVKLEPVDPKVVLPMRIGLVPSNMDKAHDMLMEV